MRLEFHIHKGFDEQLSSRVLRFFNDRVIEDILKIGKNELGRLQSVVIDVGFNGIIALVNKGDLVDLAEFN